MHPAYSVIFFTTFSGAGYGLLFIMGLFAAAQWIDPSRWFGFTGFLFAFSMIVSGLFASTYHLGHPERAWRALSQWRSSWLSREGILAVVGFFPFSLFAIGWVIFENHGGAWRLMAVLTILFAVLTVYATSMIYATLRTVRAWFNRHTVRVYLAFSLWTGSIWFNLLAHLFDLHTPGIGMIVVITGILALWIKRKYWMFLDTSPNWVPPENATGLGNIGAVKLLDSPNTQENYVQQEMGFSIARKHAEKLRRWAFFTYFLIPWSLALITVESEPWIKIPGAILAVIFVMVGTMIERWLFFAEAKHTVMLYYGAPDS
ncbi:MAG: DMSO reductase [Rhodospirillaceae bacterium]|nr:DMSO reductase [Rhodospirillaceae bacterium]|tara:strand:- start:22 stop:969 length:948 start_codon:yes stop_codon:yes gene_type:complete